VEAVVTSHSSRIAWLEVCGFRSFGSSPVRIELDAPLVVVHAAIYCGVGAVYPLLIVANHIGTGATRWPLSLLYPFVWVILLISFGALSLAGVIGAYRAKQDGRVFGELSPSGELRR
jgi:hypothetical protein